MKSILNLADGYKTYIFATAVAITVFLDAAQIIPTNESLAMIGLFGAGLAASIRHAIEKLEK